MSEENLEVARKVRQEHVALTELSSTKITNWIEQVGLKKKGVRVSRKDLVNWLIQKMPEIMANNDLSALIELFYDEATFLRQLLRESKSRKETGETAPEFELVMKAKKVKDQKLLTRANTNEPAEILDL